MNHHFIPANLGWKESDDECIKPSMGETNVTLHNVLCNSFGFGGNDSALIISDKPIPLDVISESIEPTYTTIHEITDVDKLAEVKRFVTPMEARRLGKVMKAALITSMKALEEAGIDKPDAIIIGTRFGMLDQERKYLIILQSMERMVSARPCSCKAPIILSLAR